MNPGNVDNFVAVVLCIGAKLCVLTALGYLLGMLSCLVRKKRAEKPVSGLDRRAFEDKTLEWIFGGIGRLRADLIRMGIMWLPRAKVWVLSLLLSTLLFMAGLMVTLQLLPAFLLLSCVVCLLAFLPVCLHSCRKLLRFWLLESLIAAMGGAGIVLGWPIAYSWWNPLAVYGTFVVLLLAVWTVSAGIADYDVAKLTCRAVNTGTTILLLLLNILPTAASKTGWAGQFFEARLDDWLLSVNVILLPLVFSGYLAALFVEAQNYFWSHKKKRGDDGKKPVEPGSTAKINGKEKQP